MNIDKLDEVAKSWLGTPFAINSDIKGKGVSCHLLVRAILVEAGWLPETFPRITDTVGRHDPASKIALFMDNRPEFQSLAVAGNQFLPGDCVGLRIGKVVQHIGIVVKNNWWIHVLHHKHVDRDLLITPWLERIEKIWRPIAH